MVINNSDKKKCKYHDKGFCKFRSRCLFFHHTEICGEKSCQKNQCPKRHPKPCKYYSKRKCYFGNDCKYRHDSLKQVSVTEDTDGKKKFDEKLMELEKRISDLTESNQHLLEGNNKLENKLKDVIFS